MIKLPEGELRDYLPATMKNDVDMICLSYAIRKETEQLVKYRKAAMIYHFIDSVPEPILDLLAVELRSLYYSDALPVETKRNIVKNTLRWHMQAGTPGAVKEMVKIIFGEGEVVEWPDFDDPPYTPGTFDIVTNARLTPDILDYFTSVIGRVKNARSHLRKISIERKCLLQVHAGTACSAVCRPQAAAGGYRETYAAGQEMHAGTACSAVCRPQAAAGGYRETYAAGQEMHAGTACRQQYRQTVHAEQEGVNNAAAI